MTSPDESHSRIYHSKLAQAAGAGIAVSASLVEWIPPEWLLLTGGVILLLGMFGESIAMRIPEGEKA